MVTVPGYQRTETVRPAFRQGVDVQASPDAFGAAQGRGLQQLAQGASNLGGSIAAVQELEDVNRAKEADNSYATWARERMYGENGFMTLEGRNAVDGRTAFEKEAEEKRKEFGQGLRPGAAQAYQNASQARIQSIYQQSITHTAQQQKTWFNQASAARVETFANDALANFNNPAMVQKNIAAGIMEMQEQGRLAGLDADTMKLREGTYVSGVHKNIALQIAQNDPLAAEKYLGSFGKALLPQDKFALDNALEAPILAAKAERNAANITGGVGGVSGERFTADDSGAVPGGDKAEPVANRFTPLPDTPSRFTTVASQLMGAREGTDAAAISSFIKRSAGINIDPRVTPWCAAFVNGVLGASGVEGTGKLNARSFLSFGMPTDSPKNGDIVVLSRGSGGQGHVGFFQGYDANGNIRILGGNQGDKVSVSSYSPDKLLGFRTAGAVNEQTTQLPNYSPKGLGDIYEKVNAITDPKERAATMKTIDAYYSAQKKAIDAQKEQAQSWAEGQLMQNPGFNINKIPIPVQQAIGASGMTTLLSYQEKVRTAGEPTTDERVMYDLQTEFATDPASFGQADLFQYRDKLSNSDWEKVRGWRQTALTDKRKAQEDGLNITTAFSQAETQLSAVGITTTGLKGTEREKASKRVSSFQMALSSEMDAYKKGNDGKAPNQIEIQSMINKLLLPVVIKTPGTLWGTNDQDGFLFEAGTRPDNSTVDVQATYGDIPIDLRRGIATDLERELGRKPSEDEVTQRYEDFVLQR